jgi:hypothetical protein
MPTAQVASGAVFQEHNGRVLGYYKHDRPDVEDWFTEHLMENIEPPFTVPLTITLTPWKES